MRIIEFLRRVVDAGGDVTRISYQIVTKKRSKAEEALRNILSFNGTRLRVKNTITGDTFDAVDKFLKYNDYHIKVEGMIKRGKVPGRRSINSPSENAVLVIFTAKD